MTDLLETKARFVVETEGLSLMSDEGQRMLEITKRALREGIELAALTLLPADCRNNKCKHLTSWSCRTAAILDVAAEPIT